MSDATMSINSASEEDFIASICLMESFVSLSVNERICKMAAVSMIMFVGNPSKIKTFSPVLLMNCGSRYNSSWIVTLELLMSLRTMLTIF